jgi:hypothetical protein
MKAGIKRIFPFLALLSGLVLLVFEIGRLAGGAAVGVESIFWITIAILLICISAGGILGRSGPG